MASAAMAIRSAIPLGLAAQLAISGAGVGWVALGPPARGTLLVIPLGTTPASRVLAAPGVALRGLGAWPGSLVIEGDGGLFWRALPQGLLVLRGRGASCGTKEDKG